MSPLLEIAATRSRLRARCLHGVPWEPMKIRGSIADIAKCGGLFKQTNLHRYQNQIELLKESPKDAKA